LRIAGHKSSLSTDADCVIVTEKPRDFSRGARRVTFAIACMALMIAPCLAISRSVRVAVRERRIRLSPSASAPKNVSANSCGASPVSISAMVSAKMARNASISFFVVIGPSITVPGLCLR
jgi:hypothetical protein